MTQFNEFAVYHSLFHVPCIKNPRSNQYRRNCHQHTTTYFPLCSILVHIWNNRIVTLKVQSSEKCKTTKHSIYDPIAGSKPIITACYLTFTCFPYLSCVLLLSQRVCCRPVINTSRAIGSCCILPS